MTGELVESVIEQERFSRPHREVLAIGRGTGSENTAEVQAERGRGLQPDRFGDAIHALVGLLEHPLRGKQALVDQPLMRRGSILPQEVAGEAARRHPSLLRQLFDPERLGQVVLGPTQARARVPRSRYRARRRPCGRRPVQPILVSEDHCVAALIASPDLMLISI